MKGLSALLMSGLITAMATAAVAADPPGPCTKDIASLCKEVKPGEGRLMACLKQHESSLSGTCKEYLGKVADKVKESQKVCRADVEKFCKEVQPGGGRVVKCLKEHQAEISPACRETLKTKKAK